MIKDISNTSCFLYSAILGLQAVVRSQVDVWRRRAAFKQLHHSLCVSSSPTSWELNSVHAGLRLSLGLRRVQEDGAVRGEDLPGVGGGQLALGPHQAHSVSPLQGQDEAEGHGAAAGAGATAAAVAPVAPVAPVRRGGGLQPLHAAVGHGQDGLHAAALPSRQQAGDQVASVQWGGEDP